MAGNPLSYDAIVIGSGLSGFAAASALKARKKRVLMLSTSVGATAVSSGAWDFGPSQSPFRDLPTSPAFRKILVDAPITSEAIQRAAEATAKDLEPDLKMSFRFDRPFRLPTSAGRWKHVFAAQAIQASADFEALKGKKVGLIASEAWRFRADLTAKQLGDSATIEPLWIDLSDKFADIPLSHVATRIAFDDGYRNRFVEAVKSRAEATHFDALLSPPLFLDVKLAKSLGIAELLATVEPVAGERLSSAIAKALKRMEIEHRRVSQIQAVTSDGMVRRLEVLTPGKEGWTSYQAQIYVLATGKFFGGGISLGYDDLSETIFDLPLYVSRDQGPVKTRGELPWSDAPFREEQPWAKLGVWADKSWRPVDASGEPVLRNVMACGSVIGGCDFARENFGLGLMAFMGRQCGDVAS